jgi:hypothetical protein
MPAFSFKERFVPLIQNGTKTHTIRNRRKNGQLPKVGDPIYLYYGMRTKFCTKLGEEPCIDVKSIYIDDANIILYERVLDLSELATAIRSPFHVSLPAFEVLDNQQRNDFAWADGFRPDGSKPDFTVGSFYLMQKWWQLTNDLPFVGDVIYWQKPVFPLAPDEYIEPLAGAYAD